MWHFPAKHAGKCGELTESSMGTSLCPKHSELRSPNCSQTPKQMFINTDSALIPGDIQMFYGNFRPTAVQNAMVEVK